ncbi:MAG: 50S ribosomal protein L3 [Xanthomonadaceae bacterium]|nr:50S ribosomal protein L3 [Xanthomonadaceae bacterium]
MSDNKVSTLIEGLGGIVGVKAGMTQVFGEKGESFAVTVIDLQQATVTQIKNKEKDGYVAVKVGMLSKKEKNTSKSETGSLKALNLKEGFKYYKEFRMSDSAKLEGVEVGATLSPEFLKVGDFVDLTSICKGKGFQGNMKRYHFAGGHKTHGASVSHRSLGSIGNRADPGKVFKGKKMPGQMGNVKTTIQNVKVVAVDKENGLLLVHGSVPGPKSGIVVVRRSVKKVGK